MVKKEGLKHSSKDKRHVSKDNKSKTCEGKDPTTYKIEITLLRKAPEDKEFDLIDGRKIKDIKELAYALGDMADNVFWHHVNDARNDFVNWVQDVFEEKQLAEELSKTRDKVNAQVTILKHIVNKLT
jgi:hypothetical protein